MGFIQSVNVRHYRSAYDIRDINLHSDVNVLVGPNGAGKSSFLRGLAMFSQSEKIDTDDFSVWDSSLTETTRSDIPITTFCLNPEHDRLGTLQALHKRPYYESVKIKNNEMQTIEGNSVLLNNALSTGDTLQITVFANGAYRVQTNSGRYNVETVAKKRKSDLLTIGGEIIKQLESIDLANLVPETQKITSSDINSTLASLENELEEIDDTESGLIKSDEDHDELQLLEPIYQDLQSVSEQLGDIKLILHGVKDRLPTVAYFDTIQPITDGIPRAEIQNHRAWRMFLRLGGLGSGNPQSVNQQRLESICRQAEKELTRFLNEYIEPKKPTQGEVPDPLRGRFSVVSDFESGNLVVTIEDDKEGTTIKLSKKSTGFRWLVAYILTVFVGINRSEDFDLFVVDDIGIHLHPEWKIKLRHTLYERSTDAQIIYSTHSPFLIKNNALDQIQIISHGSSSGSQVQTVAEARGSKYVHDTLEPLRSSLGARTSEFLFGADAIVVVEGKTDKQYIERFSELFRIEDGYPSLDDTIEIMIGKGSNQEVLVNFLEVQQPNFVVLTDKDESGDNVKEKISDNGIDPHKIIQLDELPTQSDGSEAEVEDLFPVKMVCEGVAQQYSSVVTAKELEDRVASTSNSDILRDLCGRLDQYEGQGQIQERDEISKEELMDYILDQIDSSWLDATDVRADSVTDFKWLIQALNSRLA